MSSKSKGNSNLVLRDKIKESKITVPMNMFERINVAAYIMRADTWETMRTLQAFRNILAPTEEETEKFGIVTEDNRTSWKEGIDTTVDIPITPLVIKEILKGLDRTVKETGECAIDDIAMYFYNKFTELQYLLDDDEY